MTDPASNDRTATRVRDELRRAVAVLDPAPPALATVRQRASRRRRNRRLTGGVAALAAAAVIAAVVVIAVPGDTARLSPARQPTARSLLRYAEAHGGLRTAGPYAGTSATYYGAFTTKRAIVVVRYGRYGWTSDGGPLTALGAGRFVIRLGVGPRLAGGTPTFAVRIVGGDVSYFGSVLRRAGGRWRPAIFGGCGHPSICTAGSNSEPYGHPATGGFVSISNSCTPYCAAGTDYRIRWRWDPARQRFVAGSVRPIAH